MLLLSHLFFFPHGLHESRSYLCLPLLQSPDAQSPHPGPIGNMHFWVLISLFLLFSLQPKSFGLLSLFVKLWVLKVVHPKFFVELSKIEIQNEGNKFLRHYFKPSCDLVSTPLPS